MRLKTSEDMLEAREAILQAQESMLKAPKGMLGAREGMPEARDGNPAQHSLLVCLLDMLLCFFLCPEALVELRHAAAVLIHQPCKHSNQEDAEQGSWAC